MSSSPACSLATIWSAGSSSTRTRTVGCRARNCATHSGIRPMLKVWVAPMRTSPVRPPPPGLQHRDAVVDLLQRAHREGQEQLAGLGRHHLLADAVEQRLADLVLELADLVRQRRLGHVDAVGRLREAEVVGQRHEVAKMPQLHVNPRVESMPSIISMGIHHFRAGADLPKLRRPCRRRQGDRRHVRIQPGKADAGRARRVRRHARPAAARIDDGTGQAHPRLRPRGRPDARRMARRPEVPRRASARSRPSGGPSSSCCRTRSACR